MAVSVALRARVSLMYFFHAICLREDARVEQARLHEGVYAVELLLALDDHIAADVDMPRGVDLSAFELLGEAVEGLPAPPDGRPLVDTASF